MRQLTGEDIKEAKTPGRITNPKQSKQWDVVYDRYGYDSTINKANNDGSIFIMCTVKFKHAGNGVYVHAEDALHDCIYMYASIYALIKHRVVDEYNSLRAGCNNTVYELRLGDAYRSPKHITDAHSYASKYSKMKSVLAKGGAIINFNMRIIKALKNISGLNRRHVK